MFCVCDLESSIGVDAVRRDCDGVKQAVFRVRGFGAEFVRHRGATCKNIEDFSDDMSIRNPIVWCLTKNGVAK